MYNKTSQIESLILHNSFNEMCNADNEFLSSNSELEQDANALLDRIDSVSFWEELTHLELETIESAITRGIQKISNWEYAIRLGVEKEDALKLLGTIRRLKAIDS